MNTKVLFVIATGMVLSTTRVNAQATDCATTASIAYEHAKVKNYASAEEPLWKVRKDCPTYSLATFQFGQKLLEDNSAFLFRSYSLSFFQFSNFILYSLLFFS